MDCKLLIERIKTVKKHAEDDVFQLVALLKEAKKPDVGRMISTPGEIFVRSECGFSRQWAHALCNRPEFIEIEDANPLESTTKVVDPSKASSSLTTFCSTATGYDAKTPSKNEPKTEDSEPEKPKSQPKTKPESEPEPEIVRDRTGHPVPEELIPLWNRTDEAKEHLFVFSKVRTLMKKLLDPNDPVYDDPLYRHVDKNTVQVDLNRLYGHLKLSIPFAVCPYCQGLLRNTCRVCKQSGFLSAFHWGTVPPEIKKLRKLSQES